MIAQVIETAFKPVTINLTFETEEGLALFSQLFNYAPVTEIHPEFQVIYEELGDLIDRYNSKYFGQMRQSIERNKI